MFKKGYHENFIVSQEKCCKTSLWLHRPTFPWKISVVELIFDASLASLSNNRNLGNQPIAENQMVTQESQGWEKQMALSNIRIKVIYTILIFIFKE